jgi:hypothetical protein
MTWGIKVRQLTFAMALIAALSLASSASWIEWLLGWLAW